MSVQVDGPDLRDVKRQVMQGDRPPYLSIEPITDFHRDTPRVPGRAAPTTRFSIRWRGQNESFEREVNGLKELYDVLRPIFKEHERAKRELDASDRKQKRACLQAAVKSALAGVKRAEKHLDQERAVLAKARRDAKS